MLTLLSDPIEQYIAAHCTPQGELHERLRQETYGNTEKPQMLVGAVEGRFLTILARLCQAKRAVEVGTFTGCSALCIAEGLPEDGRLITCDIDPTTTAIAQRYFDESPYGHKIEIRLGPALDTISAIEPGIDFAFMDADKENYPGYWEALVPKVRTGGLIVVDNVLWSGKVLDPVDDSDKGIVEVNKRIRADDRVEAVMLSVRDGITVAQKR